MVSDNASTDGSEEWMLSLIQKNPQITYFRAPQNRDVAHNLLNVVNLAKGEYCWLLTDDDCIKPGSLSYILEKLKTHAELTGISVGSQPYDITMHHKKYPLTKPYALESPIFFENAEICYSKIGAWLGFWSAQIINKKKWDAAITNEATNVYFGYPHLYIITKMLKKDPSWLFLPEPLVLYRSDNESFAKEHGRLIRYKIEATSYHLIGSHFFSEKSYAVRAVDQKILSNQLVGQMLGMKINSTSFSLLIKIALMTFKNYKSHLTFWIKWLPLFFTPRRVLLILRHIWRNYHQWKDRIKCK